jgi:hypothetical protein
MTATVSSLEDHGYLLSFGVPAMSGFLLHSNYMDGKLICTAAGAVIIPCCLSEIEDIVKGLLTNCVCRKRVSQASYGSTCARCGGLSRQEKGYSWVESKPIFGGLYHGMFNPLAY